MLRRPLLTHVSTGFAEVIACLVIIGSACGGTQPPIPAPRTVPITLPSKGWSANYTAIASAISTITASDLRAHVEELASDAYEGRGTLTPGGDKAANYLAEQFKAYGLSPIPGQTSFKVPYTLSQFSYSPTENVIEVVRGNTRTSLELGKDFSPFVFSNSGQLKETAVVFAGYGISAPDLGWDDYSELNVKGKLVLVLRHWPNEKNKESKFADTRHGLFTTKARVAQQHGAVGMLLVTDPRHHQATEDDFSDTGFIRLPLTDEEKKQSAEEQATRAKQASTSKFYAAHISQATAELLIATRRRNKKRNKNNGPDLAAIQAGLDSGTLTVKNIRLRSKASIQISAARTSAPVHPDNVIAYIKGSDPTLSQELVVIGGHYDHLGVAPTGSGDRIYNGADDNASGTSGVLELAQAFASLAVPPRRSLVFVGFSGEEKGLLGSMALLKEKQLKEEQIAFMLNLDMIGRNPNKPVEIVGDAYATTIKDAIDAANKDVGLKLDFKGTDYSGNSDHHSFFRRDIPMMFFFTGTHKDYHQLSDHSDKLAFDRMEKIVRVSYGVLNRIANADHAPSFIHRVPWLGVRIEVLKTTISGPTIEAATIVEVEDNSRAMKAGVKAGDVIVSIGGKPLTQARTIGKRFRELKPGVQVELTLERGGHQSLSISVVRAKKGFIGIYPRELTDEERTRSGLAAGQGLGIRGFPRDSAAEKAGMEEDDFIIELAGHTVGMGNLGASLARIGAGEKVLVKIIRKGRRMSLSIVLGERK